MGILQNVDKIRLNLKLIRVVIARVVSHGDNDASQRMNWEERKLTK